MRASGRRHFLSGRLDRRSPSSLPYSLPAVPYSAVDYYSFLASLSPTSAWKLDESSGTTFADLYGGKDLTYQGSGATLGISTGRSGQPYNGVKFTTSGWAIRTTALDQVVTNKFTVMGWFYQDVRSASFTNPLICASVAAGHVDPYYTFFAGCNPSNQWRLFVANSGTNSPLDTGVTVPVAGVWFHLALKYDGSLGSNNVKLFVNGTNVYQTAKTGNVQAMGSFAIDNIPALNSSSYASQSRAAGVAYWKDTPVADADITAIAAL